MKGKSFIINLNSLVQSLCFDQILFFFAVFHKFSYDKILKYLIIVCKCQGLVGHGADILLFFSNSDWIQNQKYFWKLESVSIFKKNLVAKLFVALAKYVDLLNRFGAEPDSEF